MARAFPLSLPSLANLVSVSAMPRVEMDLVATFLATSLGVLDYTGSKAQRSSSPFPLDRGSDL